MIKTRIEYIKKMNELRDILNDMENFCAEEETKFWGYEDKDFNFRVAQELARYTSAKTQLHIMGTMAAFNINI